MYSAGNIIGNRQTRRKESVLSFSAKVQNLVQPVFLFFSPSIDAFRQRIVQTVEDDEGMRLTKISNRHGSHFDNVGVSDGSKKFGFNDEIHYRVYISRRPRAVFWLHSLQGISAVLGLAIPSNSYTMLLHKPPVLHDSLDIVFVVLYAASRTLKLRHALAFVGFVCSKVDFLDFNNIEVASLAYEFPDFDFISMEPRNSFLSLFVWYCPVCGSLFYHHSSPV
mmetsp:Transcript_138/g.210  ORF Transcript_138/g.210 Transcript_138/m.210 type:complete len:222 (+) Transcript_138:829-1494(+)